MPSHGGSHILIGGIAAAPPEQDLVSLDRASNVWIGKSSLVGVIVDRSNQSPSFTDKAEDHCSFSSLGITGGKDDLDGLLDITHGSDNVTVSWSIFRDHWKGSLIGHSPSNGVQDRGHLRVTYHHNYWHHVNSRLPLFR